MSTFRTVKGFRDFFPEECATRNYIADTWRAVARRYGFVEYEAPLVESTDLFRKKSGNEITAQLFCFRDKADREITLRPEVTPSLARMATARQRDFKKPIKWFQIGPCFRYEEPQEGRGREFIQFNADILGDSGPATAAELISLAIDTMREFGVSADDFIIRLSNREIWNGFLAEKNIAAEHATAFLSIIDKIERAKPDETEKKLGEIGLTTAEVRAFMASTDENHPAFAELKANLTARGLWQHVRIDATIVRGLAYYTGMVFEVIVDGERAVAGGGRYDNLIETFGGPPTPAVGFGMGDVVLSLVLQDKGLMPSDRQIAADLGLRPDVFVISNGQPESDDAVGPMLAALRRKGMHARRSYKTTKSIGKLLQDAAACNARFAVIIESPTEVTLKNMDDNTQEKGPADELLKRVTPPAR